MEDDISNDVPKKSQEDNAFWDHTLEKLLLDIMVRVKGQNGMWQAKHFSTETWKVIILEFRRCSGCSYSMEQLKTKYQRMRKDWNTMNWLLTKNTGVGWDPINGTITADEENWKKMINVLYPSLRTYTICFGMSTFLYFFNYFDSFIFLLLICITWG